MTADADYCSEKVAKKVLYEFNMFEFLCNELQTRYRESETFQPGDVTFVGTASDSDEEERKTFALLESLLLHTRVLRDFFYNPRTKDDVIASDFVPNWNNLCPQKGEYLQKREDRLNKALAHLTLRRVEYDSNEKKWNVDAIRGEIGNAIEQFRQNLPVERKRWFGVSK